MSRAVESGEGRRCLYDGGVKRRVPVLHDSAEVTQAWIETSLGRPVRSFESSTLANSNWCSHARLEVLLAGEGLPLRLHLKIGSVTTFGRAEVDYYTSVFATLTDAPLVRCHHADADDTLQHPAR